LTAGERVTLYDLLSRAVAGLAPADDSSGCAAPEPAAYLAPEEGK
jgi:hypothetical protein